MAILDVIPPPPNYCGVQADVGDPAAVAPAFVEVRRLLGPVSVLVNNAGVAPPGRFDQISVDSWERTLRINLTGAFFCTQAALAQLRETSGCIVNVASVAGKLRSLTADAAYAASKGGLIALTRQLAFELAPEGIRVNCVCPGAADTAILERNLDPERRRVLEASIPLGRAARPEEIANVICFLAAGASSYMTGQAVDVNGGLL